jgi:hypothetical protein
MEFGLLVVKESMTVIGLNLAIREPEGLRSRKGMFCMKRIYLISAGSLYTLVPLISIERNQ